MFTSDDHRVDFDALTEAFGEALIMEPEEDRDENYYDLDPEETAPTGKTIYYNRETGEIKKL